MVDQKLEHIKIHIFKMWVWISVQFEQFSLSKLDNIHKFNNENILTLHKLDQSLHHLQYGQKLGQAKN
jgi:hypothetical protein